MLWLFFEKWYPLTIAIITSLFIFYKGYKLADIVNIGELLTATITICSILIGFLAVMMSILVTITGKRIMRRIKASNASNLLNSYFYWAVISGFIASVGSLLLTVIYQNNINYSNYILSLWLLVVLLFLLCSFRIVLVLLRILRHIIKTDEKSSDETCIVPNKDEAFS